MGCARQNAILATQAEYAREERLIPQATSVVNFVTIIGGVIGITAGACELVLQHLRIAVIHPDRSRLW